MEQNDAGCAETVSSKAELQEAKSSPQSEASWIHVAILNE